MTIDEQKIALVDAQHQIEVKQGEMRALQVAQAASDEAKAVAAKQKEINDLQKHAADLKKAIFG